MARTRLTASTSNPEASLTNEQIRELVVNEVTQAIGEAIPDIIAALREEITVLLNEHAATTIPSTENQNQTREIELETQAKKRKVVLAVTPISAVPKKSRFSDSCSGLESGGAKPRNEEGRERKCYKCGRKGHESRDCRISLAVCFNCNQTGHKRANCPSLRNTNRGEAQKAPAVTPLQITDGSSRSSGTKAVQERAYQLKVEEA